MPLRDWLLENETIRFSAYEAYSKAEIIVTNKRLIFYKKSLTSEILEAYQLDKIAGYKVTLRRRIDLIITGIILAIIGTIITHAILTDLIILPISELIFIPSFLIMIGISIIMAGFLSYPTLELTITSRKHITKPLKLPRNQIIKLTSMLHL